MQLRLHANATTTPRTRAYIQQSTASTAALAKELGIHARTVARWKARPDVVDRSTRPHRVATTISDWDEALILELRRSLALPLDDIVEAMRRCLNPQLSRSGVHRCLKRHNLSAPVTAQQTPAATASGWRAGLRCRGAHMRSINPSKRLVGHELETPWSPGGSRALYN